MTDLTCDLGRKETERWQNVNPKIIIILTVGIYRTHLQSKQQHNYEAIRISHKVFPYEERGRGSPHVEQMDIQMYRTGGRVKKD